MTNHNRRRRPAPGPEVVEPAPGPGIPMPTAWLNYPGDCRSVIGQTVGPTTTRVVLAAAHVVYDEAADRTRVGFVEVPRVGRHG